MPVQSANLRMKDMVSVLKNDCRACAPQKEPYLGVVHRLDQPVQGVIVFAKTKKAAASLSAQMAGGKERQAEKQYLAVVRGKAETPQKELVDYLLKDGKSNTSRIVPKETKGAKESRLKYQVLEEKESYSLLRIALLTGRHHQIRVQLSGAGLPIAGDRKYGQAPARQEENEPLALCAYSLTFCHPKTGKKMKFCAEPEGTLFDKFR